MRPYQNMLVVARKYNDIYYAVSTDEWRSCKEHYLLMITDRLDDSKYPMQEAFNKVITIHTKAGTIGYYQQCRKVNNIVKRLDYSTVVLSNLAMVANLCTISGNKVTNVILVEDGLMNYYDFQPSQRTSKKILELLFGIDEPKIQSKISKTYVLNPDLAKYYFGKLNKLYLNTELFAKHAKIDMTLKGKSIFVGQDLYNVKDISVEEYSEIVNRIIKEHNIDLYLPHTRCSENEEIQCAKLNLRDSLTTLEIYSSLFPLKVYSFSSSVLYTTKIINPEVMSFSIRSEKTDLINDDSIIYKYVNGVIKI